MVIPAHKKIPGTGFLVDGFKYADPSITAYFLSHAHSDHYGSLRETWSAGLIYCSQMTGKLIIHKLGVNPEFVACLPMNSPQIIHGMQNPA